MTIMKLLKSTDHLDKGQYIKKWYNMCFYLTVHEGLTCLGIFDKNALNFYEYCKKNFTSTPSPNTMIHTENHKNFINELCKHFKIYIVINSTLHANNNTYISDFYVMRFGNLKDKQVYIIHDNNHYTLRTTSFDKLIDVQQNEVDDIIMQNNIFNKKKLEQIVNDYNMALKISEEQQNCAAKEQEQLSAKEQEQLRVKEEQLRVKEEQLRVKEQEQLRAKEQEQLRVKEEQLRVKEQEQLRAKEQEQLRAKEQQLRIKVQQQHAKAQQQRDNEARFALALQLIEEQKIAIYRRYENEISYILAKKLHDEEVRIHV